VQVLYKDETLMLKSLDSLCYCLTSMPVKFAQARRIWLYKHANFERANNLLCDIDLNDILIPSDIQLSWSHFKATFLSVMEQCIPQTVLPDRKNLPWLSKEIIQLIRKRNHYFRQAHGGNSHDHLKFKQLPYSGKFSLVQIFV